MPDNVKDNPVGKREALLADRLRLHKGYRYTEVEIFSKGDFTLGTNWFEGEVTVGDVAEFFQRSGDTLYDKLGAGWSWRGATGEIERARECLEKVLGVRGTTLEEVRTARGRRLLSQDRMMAETMAFLLTDCTFADIAELIGGVPGRVENEVFETYYAASNWNIDEDVQKALHTGIIYYAWNVGNPNRPLCLPPVLKARGRCGNGDSGAAFPPFQQPAGRARNPPAIESAEKPSTWRKRELTCRGFQHSDRLRVSLGTLRPSKC